MGKRLAVLLLQIAAWSYYFLPPAGRRAVAFLLALPMRVSGLRGEVVRANLERAYPGTSELRRRKQIERASYVHLAQLGLEILMLFGPMPGFARKFTRIRGTENWKNARAAGKGVILLSSHLGNWEIMVAAGAVQERMDLLIVTKHLKPEWLHEKIEMGRRACGVEATYEPKTLRDVLGHLNRNGTVGFVLDQYAGPPIGVRVPFFGTNVGTPNVVAALSKRTGAPVLPVINYRDENGNFVVDIRPPLDWITSSDYSGAELSSYELAANTAKYAHVLESDIREHPEQWLWIHRRFKGDLSPLKPDEWASGRQRR